MADSTPTTLFEFYTGLGMALPPIEERAILFASYELGDAASYTGTAEQNNRLLAALIDITSTPDDPEAAQAADIAEIQTLIDSLEESLELANQSLALIEQSIADFNVASELFETFPKPSQLPPDATSYMTWLTSQGYGGQIDAAMWHLVNDLYNPPELKFSTLYPQLLSDIQNLIPGIKETLASQQNALETVAQFSPEPDKLFAVPDDVSFQPMLGAPGVYVSQPYVFEESGQWSVKGISREILNSKPVDELKFYAGQGGGAFYDGASSEVSNTVKEVIAPHLPVGLGNIWKKIKDGGVIGGLLKGFWEDTLKEVSEGFDAIQRGRSWDDSKAWERTHQFNNDLDAQTVKMIGGKAGSMISKAIEKARVILQHSDLTIAVHDAALVPEWSAPNGHAVAILGSGLGDTLSGWNLNDLLIGQDGDDHFLGLSGDDLLIGRGGADSLQGGDGNDVLKGGAGNDTAVYTGNRDAYNIPGAASGTVSGPEGTDTLIDIERYQFSDKNLAFDLQVDQAAGNTLRIIGAAFDAPAIQQHPDWVGIGLELFDSGMSMQAVCEVVTQMLALSNADLVTTLYTNVVGSAPADAVRDSYAGLLQGSGGAMTQAELLVLAANAAVNEQNINLVGLQQAGVEFI